MRHSSWLYQYPDLCGHASYCSSHNFIGGSLFICFVFLVKYSCESARCQLRYSFNDISIINVLFPHFFHFRFPVRVLSATPYLYLYRQTSRLARQHSSTSSIKMVFLNVSLRNCFSRLINDAVIWFLYFFYVLLRVFERFFDYFLGWFFK